MRLAKRLERPVCAQEWTAALAWSRMQRVNKALERHRKELVAQFWIELRTPPVTGEKLSPEDERNRAWMRACKVVRQENERIDDFDVPPIPRGYAYRHDKNPERIKKVLV
jgi:hypothetical protein